MMKRFVVLMMAVVAAIAVQVAAGTSDTAFTYQGELKQADALANGAFDMEFSLWNALAGGSQIGGFETLDEVPVADGRFTVELDFGAAAFNGEPRWLQVEVNGTVLAPRQPITHTPYALQTRGIFVNDDETFVGVGRNNSVSISEVFGVYAPTTSSYGGMYVECAGQNAWPFYGYAAGPTADAWHYFEGNTGKWHLNVGGVNRLSVDSTGHVGIGTTSPAAWLHVFRPEGTSGTVDPVRISTTTGSPFNITGTMSLSSTSINTSSSIGSSELRLNDISPDDVLIADGGGNVGIGELDDTTRLRVASSTNTAIWASADGTAGGSQRAILAIGDGPARAISARANGESGVAIHADAVGSGTSIGTVGQSWSSEGVGISGETLSNTGVTYGVRGWSNSPSGFDFYASGAGTNYGAASSLRWKHDIELIANPLDKLAQLRGVYFTWDKDHGGHRDVGMIAEEVGEVLPEIVNYEANGIDAIGMDYSKLTPLLVEAVNALRAEKDAEIEAVVAQKDAEIANLQPQIDELRGMVRTLAHSTRE